MNPGLSIELIFKANNTTHPSKKIVKQIYTRLNFNLIFGGLIIKSAVQI